MKSVTYIVASHVYYPDGKHDVYGPAHTVYDFLRTHKKEAMFIKHCIENKYPTQVISRGITKLIPIPLSFLAAFIKKFIISVVSCPRGDLVVISVDPFNGLFAAFMKLTRRARLIYYTPDYTEVRYQNWLLNKLYFFIDRTALSFADEVWSVSTRIQRLRKSQGVQDEKNIYVPNTPDYISMPRHRYNGNKSLVVVANLTTSFHYEPILQAVRDLSRVWGDLRLNIYGDGQMKRQLEKRIVDLKLGKVVVLKGHRSHDDILEEISQSFLGFALYTKASRGTYYGDSMKAREYVACSIPVIINDLPSTSEDISAFDAGIVLEKISRQEIAAFVSRCVNNRSYYLRLRKNAMVLGQRYDKSRLLARLLS